MREWKKITVTDPPENVLVLTRINDEFGARNEAKLQRRGRLCFVEDGGMYVYYTPTEFVEPEDKS